MKIILDVMSGDNAPEEILKGAFMARAELNHELVLVGNTDVINEYAEKNGFDLTQDGIEVVNASEVITMEDDPLAVRTKRDSSMAVALRLLKEGKGDALVSAGNTGALYTGSVLLVSRIPGFRKAAIAAVLPFEKPVLLLDSGANVIVTAEILEQFALIGSLYMSKVMGIDNPRIGLLNNGVERTKGSQMLQDTYVLLEENKNLNFVGNIECKALPFNACDVIVTDGFTGNAVLKLAEGLGAFFMKKLKRVFKKNAVTKISAMMVKPGLKQMKKDFDASEHGGAPLLGVAKPVLKAHGSSDAKAIKNAIRAAARYAETNIINEIAAISEAINGSSKKGDATEQPSPKGYFKLNVTKF